jgi:hypothetical protein
MDNWPIPRFWLFASRSRILPPKTKVLKYLTNYVRAITDQADDPHHRLLTCNGSGKDDHDAYDDDYM